MRQRKSVLPSFMDPKHIIKQDEELPTVTAVPLSLDSPTTGNASRRVYEVEMQPLHQHKDESERSNDDYHQIDELMYPVRILRPKGSWEHRVQDFLFPPHVPRECQLLRPENIAVPLTYLLVGLLQGLSSPLINVFPLDLRATEAAMTTISGIRSLPACFKILFGFISDTSPILGYRRKPYMMIGWLLASFSILCILVFSNTHVPPRNSGFFGTDADEESSSASEENKIPEDAPSIPFLALSLLGFGTGFWMADVMGDSIVAEKAKLEPPESRGSVQSSCYSYRFFGVMVAAPLSSYIYSAAGPTYVFYILAFMPLTILPFIYLLAEQRDRPVASVKEQCQEIWGTVCSRAVWQPMGFVFLFNAMQVGNGAWREFQTVVLKFTSFQLNIFLIVAYILLYFGVLTYKYFMMGWSWRKVYIFTTFLNAFFSVLQVLLIYGITFGLPSFWFALGDDVFSDFIEGVQFLPTTIMMVHLCPSGSEGAAYAMFTTVNNSALNLSSILSTNLLSIWDVSTQALEQGQLQGLANLTYLTSGIQFAAIFFVGLLPHYKEDLEVLKNSTRLSWIGGGLFLGVTATSLLYTIIIGLLNIVAPGWMGES